MPHSFYPPTKRLHRLAFALREPRPSSLIRSSHAITPAPVSQSVGGGQRKLNTSEQGDGLRKYGLQRKWVVEPALSLGRVVVHNAFVPRRHRHHVHLAVWKRSLPPSTDLVTLKKHAKREGGKRAPPAAMSSSTSISVQT